MDGGGALYFPIRLRCAAVPDLLASAGLEAAIARALRRSFARARQALPPQVSVGGGVALQAPSLTSGNLPAADAARLLDRVRRAIAAAARGAALPIAPTGRASPLPRTEVSERFDPARFDAASGTYLVPSYDRGKARIAVDPGHAAAPPPDWDDIARKLRDPNPLVRSYAFYNIHGLVEAGDEQAVRIAIWGVRADGEDPTAQIFASLRALASHDPRRFRELLRALREAYQSTIGTRFKRTETTVPIILSEAAALHILGALEKVALTIPEGRIVASAWEAEAPGLARTTALVSALAAARTELYRYLTSSTVWVRARALSGQLVEQIQKDTDSLLEYPAIALLISLRDPSGADFVYAFEEDLVENYRWILASLDKVQEIDQALDFYRSVFGDQISFMDEGRALLDARARYLSKLAENPVPTANRISQLRRDADAFYADWVGRAADAKYDKLMTMRDQLAKPFVELRVANQWFPDNYDDRYSRTLSELLGINDALREAQQLRQGPGRGPDYLAQVSEAERALPPFGVHVALLQLWNGIHNLLYFILDKDIGNDNQKNYWLPQIHRALWGTAEKFDRFDYSDIQSYIEAEQRWLVWIGRDVGREVRWEAFVKIFFAVAAIALTAGAAAPEGAGVISMTLGSAAIFTGASIVSDIAIGKAPSVREIGIDFGKNVLFIGVLHVLNAKLFDIAIDYPGHALTRLAIVFGGSGLATVMPPLVIDRLQTGAWPDHIAAYFAASGLLSAVAGAIAGPRLIEALGKLDRIEAEVRGLMEQLVAERQAWLGDLERAARPEANPADFEAAKRRGTVVYQDFEKLAEAMKRLPDSVLRRLNLSAAIVEDLQAKAGSYARKIAGMSHDRPRGAELPAPLEVVPRGLKPTGSNTFEFNPNSPGFDPRTLADRFRNAGYHVTETGGVLHVRAPREETARFLLLPAAPDIPAPALAKLITRRGTYAANGLDVVRAQRTWPALERMLADIANTKPGIARSILEGMGRHKITDDEAIRGVGRFLEAGGKPEALAVALGNGNRFGARETIATLRKFGSLTPGERKGIDKIVELHGELGHGTDSIVGIGAYHDPAGPIYAAIDELAPYTERGLGQFIDQLASENAGRRQEAENALSRARELLAKGASPKLRFDRRTVDGVQALRVRDVSEDSAEAYLVAVRASTGADSLVGASWDNARFPKGPRGDWQPKDPVDMPDSSGIYPTPDTGRGRWWRNRAAFEIEARAKGIRTYRPSSSDPISAMSDADLVTLRDTPTSRVRSPLDPFTGRPLELEHVFVQQRVGRWLQDAGFAPSEARRLSRAADPGNLMDVSQIEHAFLDAGAASYPHRTDVTGRTWSQTSWADIRAREPFTYMTDDTLTEIVVRANSDPTIKLRNAPDLLRALRAEIARRRLPLTIR